MDTETKIELVTKPPTEEVISLEELRTLFETKTHPVAYNGFEPSGKIHLGTGLICGYKIKDFIKAGIKFKIYLASWHAWINNKLGGDMEKIKLAARHFVHGWTSLGINPKKVEYILADEAYNDITYWEKVIKSSKMLTVARARRTLQIMGRKKDEGTKVSDFLYTPMQVSDIFHFEVDICQLGMDQRKANMVAREIGEKIGFYKPVCVHNHLLAGLSEPRKTGMDENAQLDQSISSKMSKSRPETCIFIYDSKEDIKRKIAKAYCPQARVDFNPIMETARHIIFREQKELRIERDKKYGGDLSLGSYEELENVFVDGKLHPMDLKNAVSEALIRILAPSRTYFKTNKEAKKCLQALEQAKITR